MNIDANNSIAFVWPDVAGALLAAQGITTGLWFVGVSLNFAGGVNNWKQEPSGEMHFAPTGLVGIQAVVIAPASEAGPMVFNAAELAGKKFGRAVLAVPTGTTVEEVKAAAKKSASGTAAPKKATKQKPSPPPEAMAALNQRKLNLSRKR